MNTLMVFPTDAVTHKTEVILNGQAVRPLFFNMRHGAKGGHQLNIFFTFKYNMPMQFIYATRIDCLHAEYDGEPELRDDAPLHQFDVRDLPSDILKEYPPEFEPAKIVKGKADRDAKRVANALGMRAQLFAHISAIRLSVQRNVKLTPFDRGLTTLEQFHAELKKGQR